MLSSYYYFTSFKDKLLQWMWLVAGNILTLMKSWL